MSWFGTTPRWVMPEAGQDQGSNQQVQAPFARGTAAAPLQQASENAGQGWAAVDNSLSSHKGCGFRLRQRLRCFCEGGRRCRSEDPEFSPRQPSIVPGVLSSWVGDNVLAMSRPSERRNAQYGTLSALVAAGVTGVINLQEIGEHAHCGDGLAPGSAFSYHPESLMDVNILHLNYPFSDMGVPSLVQAMKVVQVMEGLVMRGGKVAVHCHAGLGRTGCIIACFLIYSEGMSPAEAVEYVRQHRPGSVQTHAQVRFVGMFDKYVSLLRSVYDVGESSGQVQEESEWHGRVERKRQGAEPEVSRSQSFSFSPPPKLKLSEASLPGAGKGDPVRRKASSSQKSLRRAEKKRERVRSLVQAGQKGPVPVKIDGSVRQVHRATIDSVHDLVALQRLQLHGIESKELRDFPQIFHKLFCVLKRSDGIASSQRRKWSLTAPPSLPSSPRSPRIGARVAPAGPRSLDLIMSCIWPWLPTDMLKLDPPGDDAPPTPTPEELSRIKVHVNRGNWRQVEGISPVCALHLFSDLVFSIHQPIVSAGDMHKLIQASTFHEASLSRCTRTILVRVALLLAALSAPLHEEPASPRKAPAATPSSATGAGDSAAPPRPLQASARFASFWFAWLLLRPAVCDEGALLHVTALAKMLRQPDQGGAA